MAKVKLTTPVTTVAKKDNTRVARTRVNELVGDKPNMTLSNSKTNKNEYKKGFNDQVLKNKIAGKSTREGKVLGDAFRLDYLAGAGEANIRRDLGQLSKSAMVRDSSIPLAPTQFPE